MANQKDSRWTSPAAEEWMKLNVWQRGITVTLQNQPLSRTTYTTGIPLVHHVALANATYHIFDSCFELQVSYQLDKVGSDIPHYSSRVHIFSWP